MPDSNVIVSFIIVSFALAIVLILKKDSIPPQFKRGLSLLAIVMVVISFIMIVASFLTLPAS